MGGQITSTDDLRFEVGVLWLVPILPKDLRILQRFSSRGAEVWTVFSESEGEKGEREIENSAALVESGFGR